MGRLHQPPIQWHLWYPLAISHWKMSNLDLHVVGDFPSCFIAREYDHRRVEVLYKALRSTCKTIHNPKKRQIWQLYNYIQYNYQKISQPVSHPHPLRNVPIHQHLPRSIARADPRQRVVVVLRRDHLAVHCQQKILALSLGRLWRHHAFHNTVFEKVWLWDFWKDGATNNNDDNNNNNCNNNNYNNDNDI